MTITSILSKLSQALKADIATEAEVVHILVEVRKALERKKENKKYFGLDFYCSFALHTQMSRAGARRILKRFDRAHPFILKKQEIPEALKADIERTTLLQVFETDLKRFLKANDLPTRLFTEKNAWVNFIRLYCGVIADCELVLRGDGAAHLVNIDRAEVRLDVPKEFEPLGPMAPFGLRWICHGKNGKRTEHFVIRFPV